MLRILGAKMKENVLSLQHVLLADGGVSRLEVGAGVLKHSALQGLHLQQLAAVVLFRFFGLRQRGQQQNGKRHSFSHQEFPCPGLAVCMWEDRETYCLPNCVASEDHGSNPGGNVSQKRPSLPAAGKRHGVVGFARNDTTIGVGT